MLFMLPILIEEVEPGPFDYLFQAIAIILLIGSFIFILGSFIHTFDIDDKIKLFLKKKSNNYGGFTIGNRVIRATWEWRDSIPVHVQSFLYNRDKEIYAIAFSDDKIYKVWEITLIKPKVTRSNLPGWW